MLEQTEPRTPLISTDREGHFDAGSGALREPAFSATDMTLTAIGLGDNNQAALEDAFLAAGGEGVAAAAQELINMPPEETVINE